MVILGPTASGKTALSLTLAQEFSGEIISADSRQVYRHMDIGTDKILPAARCGVAHHLIDVAEPTERFTVADFKRQAEEAADAILVRGTVPFLVGGTGLYIRALTENFSIPAENKEVRGKLTEELHERGADWMHEKLKKLDPEGAAKIHPRNIPYTVRALEIFLSTGRPKRDQRSAPKYDVFLLGLSWPREKLFERIERRVDEQIARGLLDETRRLLEMGYGRELASMKSLGYREMTAHLAGELSLEGAVELLKKNTRNFAKRQMTWFKRDTGVLWVEN